MNDFFELQKKIKYIKKLGWIKCNNNYYNVAGITFEKLIGKEIENFPIPDYNGIEIKTKCKNSRSRISLFSATPDSFLFENKRLVALYGYPDKQLPKYNVLNNSVSSKTLTYIGNNRNLGIEVDWNNKKVILNVYRGQLEIIDNLTSWSFELIEEKVNLKLKKLCYVTADKLNYKNNTYVKYISDYYYNIKDINTFFKLIEDGTIWVTFKLGIFKTGRKIGMLHDHGTSFEIYQKDLEKLYNKIP